MKDAMTWTLQLVAALGALGVFWQIGATARAHRAKRRALLDIACRRRGDDLLVTVIWRGAVPSEGYRIDACVLAPRDAVIAPDESEQKGAPARRASDDLWRPFHSRGGLRMGEEIMTRFRISAPQQLTRIRLKLRLKSTATERTLIRVTRWLSPAP